MQCFQCGLHTSALISRRPWKLWKRANVGSGQSFCKVRICSNTCKIHHCQSHAAVKERLPSSHVLEDEVLTVPCHGPGPKKPTRAVQSWKALRAHAKRCARMPY